MSQACVIAEFSFEKDLEAVLDVWRNAGDGIALRDSDRPEEIRKKLLRDPDLFLTASLDGRIVGAVMGGFDGRRGFVYHLAVSKAFRSQGIARQLMAEVERRLKEKGCLKVNLLVMNHNQSVIEFYKDLGYEAIPAIPFGKML